MLRTNKYEIAIFRNGRLTKVSYKILYIYDFMMKVWF